jgi:hypothetical protein
MVVSWALTFFSYYDDYNKGFFKINYILYESWLFIYIIVSTRGENAECEVYVCNT